MYKATISKGKKLKGEVCIKFVSQMAHQVAHLVSVALRD